MSAGCHELIRRTTDPAYLVTDADAVLEVVGRFGETVPRREGEPTERAEQSTGSPLDQLDPVARRVFDGLPARRAALVEEISRTSGVAVLEVLRSLPVLEVLGLIEAGPEGYRISRAHRAKSRVAP
jgi:DNA processing protein